MMTSRREFLTKSFAAVVLAAVSSPLRTHQARFALREVFVTPSIPAITSDLPPGEKERPWPPVSATLIYGERDAVLVDAFITAEQSRALANWVAASGKNLANSRRLTEQRSFFRAFDQNRLTDTLLAIRSTFSKMLEKRWCSAATLCVSKPYSSMTLALVSSLIQIP